MLNKNFIEKKVALIEEDIYRLKNLSNISMKEIISSYEKQAVIERLIEKIITRAIDINQHLIKSLEEKSIPDNYKDTFLILADLKIFSRKFGENISKSVGLRNILIHDYDKIDYNMLYLSIFDCISDYIKYCDYILKFLKK